MKKRNWKIEEKLSIVLQGIKNQKTITEICSENKISQSQYYKWRDRFLEGGKKALSNRKMKDNRKEVEIEQLQKLIGKQAIQIEILKKTEELMGI